MNMLFLALILLMPCWNQTASTVQWKFQKEKNGIKVYTRPSQMSKFDEVKAEFDLQTTMSKFIFIISDVNNYDNWVYGTKATRLCERLNNDEIIYHSVISAPWPFSDRDYYSKMTISQDAVNKFTISSTGLPNFRPEESSVVRIPYLHSTYTAVVTSNPSILHITYTLNIDAGGDVPGWLVNMFSNEGPIESFTNLKKLCR